MKVSNKNSSKHNQLVLLCWRLGLHQIETKTSTKWENWLCFDEFLIRNERCLSASVSEQVWLCVCASHILADTIDTVLSSQHTQLSFTTSAGTTPAPHTHTYRETDRQRERRTCLRWGGRYQTSTTSAQLVMMLSRWRSSVCLLLFQNASANRESYWTVNTQSQSLTHSLTHSTPSTVCPASSSAAVHRLHSYVVITDP